MNDIDKSSGLTGFEIAVVGMAGRFPGAPNLETFWANLSNGIESASWFTKEELAANGVPEATIEHPGYVPVRGVLQDAELFDARFFGYYPREAQMLDPQHRLFLECVWEALEDACIVPGENVGPIGVFAGSGINSYGIHAASDPSIATAVDPYQIHFSNSPHLLATRVSYKLNLRGPSLTVMTACSTSLTAIHLACQSLLQGESAIAIAGGVRIAFPQRTGHVYVPGGALSPDGHCRVFDADAQGTFSSDAVGAVILKRLEDAVADGDRIRAVIKGSAVNNDGSDKVGFAAPSVRGQAEAIRAALHIASVDPQTIDYVEAHGAGTPLGDPIEVASLTEAFGVSRQPSYCALGSVKSNIGHADAAAGIAGFIKTVLALENGMLPPSLHFRRPNPELKLDGGPFYVNTTLKQWPIRDHPKRASVSSFGIGGTNAHVILEEWPPPAPAPSPSSWQLLTVSAKTANSLEAALRKLETHLTSHPNQDLADVAYTTQVGRAAFPHRGIVLCQSSSDVVKKLKTRDPEMVRTGVTNLRPDAPITFLFPGGGSQYVEMGRGLYESDIVYRNCIDTCADILRRHLPYDLRAVLYNQTFESREANSRLLNEPVLIAASLFSTSYALAHLWMSWGIRPADLIGHSLGEYVAACLSGVLTLEDALALITKRSKLIERLPTGVMLSVKMEEERLQSLLPPSVSIAAVNGPGTCVVSGPPKVIRDLEVILNREAVWCQCLKVAAAGHSAAIASILPDFAGELRKITLSPPRIQYISSLTGTWITPEQATSPDYWVNHLCGTVRFGAGIDKLLADDSRVLIEVGPGHTLTTFTCCSNLRLATHLAIPSMRHADDHIDDRAYLLCSLGRIWMAGLRVDWDRVHSGERRKRVALPTYSFERQRYTVRLSSQAVEDNSSNSNPGNHAEEAISLADSPGANLSAPGSVPTMLHDETEGQLTTMWEELFGISPISRHDNFFKLGGHSFLATRLLFLIEQRWNVRMTVRTLFSAPTIAELARLIDAKDGGQSSHQCNLRELLEDSTLPQEIPTVTVNQPDESPSGAALLTGATGYLGAYILHELIKQSSDTIYCLVRAHAEEDPFGRIRDNLASHHLWDDTFTTRIALVSGDLGRPLFGLNENYYQELAQRIGAIYNCGAQVHFTYPYSMLKRANVDGVREIVRFACNRQRKVVHHISTLAVFPIVNPTSREIFEHSDIGSSEGIYTAYAQSKWVAERIIDAGRRGGLKSVIYRAGAVLGDTQNARCRSGDFVWRMLKGAVQLGKAPHMESAIPAAPADYVSGAIVKLSLDRSSYGKNFHVIGPEPLYWRDIFEVARGEGFLLENVSYSTWYEELFKQARQDGSGALYPIVHQIDYERYRCTRFMCSDTQHALGTWPGANPHIGLDLLKRYIRNLISSGFLPSPPRKQ